MNPHIGKIHDEFVSETRKGHGNLDVPLACRTIMCKCKRVDGNYGRVKFIFPGFIRTYLDCATENLGFVVIDPKPAKFNIECASNKGNIDGSRSRIVIDVVVCHLCELDGKIADDKAILIALWGTFRWCCFLTCQTSADTGEYLSGFSLAFDGTNLKGMGFCIRHIVDAFHRDRFIRCKRLNERDIHHLAVHYKFNPYTGLCNVCVIGKVRGNDNSLSGCHVEHGLTCLSTLFRIRRLGKEPPEKTRLFRHLGDVEISKLNIPFSSLRGGKIDRSKDARSDDLLSIIRPDTPTVGKAPGEPLHIHLRKGI